MQTIVSVVSGGEEDKEVKQGNDKKTRRMRLVGVATSKLVWVTRSRSLRGVGTGW